jgi:hypothetical protein
MKEERDNSEEGNIKGGYSAPKYHEDLANTILRVVQAITEIYKE